MGATHPEANEFWVANEFASCRLRMVNVGNGRRIEIRSERRNTKVLLDAMALDALTQLTPDEVSQLLTLVTEQSATNESRQIS